MQVLVQGVRRRHFSRVGRFVNQHGMHSSDVWSGEALDVVQKLRKVTKVSKAKTLHQYVFTQDTRFSGLNFAIVKDRKQEASH